MNIAGHTCYKQFVREWVARRGRGGFRAIAIALGVQSSMISQVFNGILNLSLEQTILLAEFFGLNPVETDYLILLVQLERAGSEKLRAYYHAKVDLQRQLLTPRVLEPTPLSMAQPP